MNGRFPFVAMVLAVAASYAQPQELPPIPEALKQAPLSSEGREELARALEAKDYRTAETILVSAIDAEPKSPGLLILAARVFFLDKNPANSAIALKKAEKLRPLAEPERFLLAMAYLGIGRGSWARLELEKLPKRPPYEYWLARIDYDEHKYQQAIGRLRAVTAADPASMRAWDNLGLSLEGAGEIDGAVASYREAIRLDREQNLHSPWPPLNLATLLTKTGELKEAEELIREALRYESGLAEAHYRLGVNLRKQGRTEPAIAELRLAIELNPAAAEPLYALGQTLHEQGDEAAATEFFSRFKELKKKQRGM
jgi:tetratricopeptide (TPR) repeat protein